MSLDKEMNHSATRALLSLPTGFIGGCFCGFVILSFGALIGRSGDTGYEYIGYWSPAYICLGGIYGGPLGFIFYPFGYIIFLRGIPLNRLFAVIWKIGAFTITGGCIGCIVNQFLAVFTGLFGFYIGCWIYQKKNV